MKVSPSQAFGWAVVSMISAVFCQTVGQIIQPFYSPMQQFVYGIGAIIVTGFMILFFTERTLAAIRGQQTNDQQTTGN